MNLFVDDAGRQVPEVLQQLEFDVLQPGPLVRDEQHRAKLPPSTDSHCERGADLAHSGDLFRLIQKRIEDLVPIADCRSRLRRGARRVAQCRVFITRDTGRAVPGNRLYFRGSAGHGPWVWGLGERVGIGRC